MKKWKNLSTRGFALFLALVMCLGAMQVTAFADVVDVSDNPPDPVGDVVTDVTNDSETNDDGETTNTETTNTSWSDSQKTEGEFIPDEDGTDVEVNQTVDGETGVKTEIKVETETATKTDVTTEVNGSQTESKSETYDENGNLIADSSSLSGEQTTTTTTETTTQTTTTTTTTTTNPTETETTKETGPTETTTGQLIVGDNDKKEGDVAYGKFESDETAADKAEEKKDVDLSKVTDVGLTVDLTAGNGKAESKETKEVTPDLDAAKEFVKQTLKNAGMENWLVTDASGQTEGHGTVDAEDIQLKQNDDGSYSYTFWARIPEGQVDKTGKGDAETTITSVNGNRNTTDNEDAVVEETVTTVENEDGSVTTTVVTTTSTATNTWTTTTTTVEKYEMGVLAKQVTVTVKPGTIKVTGEMGDSHANAGHGQITASSLGPGSDKHNGENAGDKFADYYVRDMFVTTTKIGANGTPATIRAVKDKDGNTVYVYCVQHNLNISKNNGVKDENGISSPTNYNKYVLVNAEEYVGNYTGLGFMIVDGTVTIGDETGHDKWSISAKDAAHVQYIVEHGWWDAAGSGTGSLTAVKSLLRKDVAAHLTDDIAAAVTQAALWHFTDYEGGTLFSGDTAVVTKENNPSLSDEAIEAANELFEALIKGNTDMQDLEDKDENGEEWNNYLKNGSTTNPNGTTQLLKGDSFTSSTVNVVQKIDVTTMEDLNRAAADFHDDNTLTHATIQDLNAAKGNSLYATNLSLTLAVVPSRLNADELVVYVYADGIDKPIASKRLDANLTDNTSDSYTIEIPNVVLPANTNLRVNLKGTQKLEAGAYLFSCGDFKNAQTFGSYITGTDNNHQVDIDVNLEFNVEKVAQQETTVSTQTGTQDRTWTETTVTEQGKRSTTTTTETETTEVTVTTEVEVTYSEPETAVEEEQVIWSAEDANEYEVPEIPEYPDTPDTPDTPVIPETPETPDEPVVETPETPDEPVVEVPDERTPLEEIPEEPTPLNDVVPVEEEIAPAEEEEILEELPEDPVPLAEMPAEEEEPEAEELLELPEDPVPLADVPATGDISALWYFTALLSALGLVILTVKKREEEAK